MAVPRNVLTAHQIHLIEANLAGGLLGAVANNFPNWQQRAVVGDIAGGEIILQDTDMTQPIRGLTPGIHLTISLVSFRPERNFDGLATEAIQLIKQTQDEHGFFMAKVGVFVQMSLNRLVVRGDTSGFYVPSEQGENLLEYSD
jgi:hypothetical protein